MSKTFTCHLHKRGIMAPELRIVTCHSEKALPDTILAQMRGWPRFEVVEVYGKDDEQLYRFTLNEHWLN